MGVIDDTGYGSACVREVVGDPDSGDVVEVGSVRYFEIKADEFAKLAADAAIKAKRGGVTDEVRAVLEASSDRWCTVAANYHALAQEKQARKD